VKKKATKTILVIGGTGFIGHHLLKKTTDLGWSSFCISRKKVVKNRFIKKVKYIKLDINKKKNFKEIFRRAYDYVIDLSNTSLSSKTYSIKNLIRIINEKKIKKFIHVGSSAEYGNLGNLPLSEKLNCKPVSRYGKKKLDITKNLLRIYKKNPFPIIVLRLFQVYGPNDDKNKIIPFILDNCLRNRKFKLTKGYQTRDFCHINDVVQAILLFLKSRKKTLFGNIFNVGTGKSITIKKLVRMIKKNIEYGQPIFGAKKISKNEIIFSKSSTIKTKQYINWNSKISLEKGLKELIYNAG